MEIIKFFLKLMFGYYVLKFIFTHPLYLIPALAIVLAPIGYGIFLVLLFG